MCLRLVNIRHEARNASFAHRLNKSNEPIWAPAAFEATILQLSGTPPGLI